MAGRSMPKAAKGTKTRRVGRPSQGSQVRSGTKSRRGASVAQAGYGRTGTKSQNRGYGAFA